MFEGNCTRCFERLACSLGPIAYFTSTRGERSVSCGQNEWVINLDILVDIIVDIDDLCVWWHHAQYTDLLPLNRLQSTTCGSQRRQPNLTRCRLYALHCTIEAFKIKFCKTFHGTELSIQHCPQAPSATGLAHQSGKYSHWPAIRLSLTKRS